MPVYAKTIETRQAKQALLNQQAGRGKRSRSETTRNAILDAAVALYQLQGIANTSISAVIEKSGVGRTTFYRHFNDRDDVLNQALTRDFEQLMFDFETAAHRYDSLEVQIEQDMLWFLDQFAHRPALALLFSDVDWKDFQQAAQSLQSFRSAAIACATPTFERAKAEGRLRDGIDLEQYIDWASFVVVSMQVVKLPNLENPVRSRAMLRNFLVPSLISME